MNSLRRFVLAAAAIVGAMPVLAADANLAGEWDLSIDSQMGVVTPHLSLKQQGSALSGTYQGRLGELPVTGTVKGNEFIVTFKGNAQGTEVQVTYSGTVNGDAMQGMARLGEMGEAKLTGKKSG